MYSKIKANLFDVNWSLLFTLMAINFIPTIYTTTRIFFIGDLPNDWGVNIASQLAWVNVLYEVIQEGLILPLFYLIGQSVKNKMEIENKLKSGLITSFVIYFLFSIVLFLFAKNLLIGMSQQNIMIEASVIYIRIETISIMISIFYKFISIFLITMNKYKELLVLLLFQMIMTIVSDILLVSTFAISFNMGVNGIAIGNIIVNTLLFIVSIFLLKRDNINIFSKGKIYFDWQKEWIKVGWRSGLESFVRNFAFIVMILKMINMVQQQSNFWIANNFIWGWLLVPIMALGTLIKSDVSKDYNLAKKMFGTYMLLTVGVVGIWFLTMPLWKLFILKMMNVSEYEIVYKVIIVSLGFYVIFALNNVIDSIFYGLGRTDLMLYQSLIVNTIFYGTMFILFKAHIFVPSLYNLAIMFGLGIAVDSFITFLMYYYLYKKDRLLANRG